MKRLMVASVILLMVIVLISGCSSGQTTTPPATTSVPTTSLPTTTTPSTSKPTATTTATTPATTSPVSPKPTTGSKTYGGTLRYITAAGPGAPFGLPWQSNGTSTFGMQFTQQFLLKEQSDASLKPGLASSYDVVSDPANPSVTLHLTKGIKFHDGTDFNAQAVKWNFEKSMGAASTTRGSTTNWKSIDVIDDYTVRINLKTWQNTAVRTFADSVSFMVSPTAFEKNGADWMAYNMVGTGPFVQKDFQRDVYLKVGKNPSYWESGKPYLDGIDYLFVSDPLTAEAFFKSGGAEVLQTYSDEMTSRLRAAGYKMIASQVGGSTSMWPDSANPDSPWSNAKVREAAEYAIDKESMAKTFGYGNWTAAYQASTSVSPAYDPSLAPRTYNVAKAKQILTEAGYPTGFKTNIIVSPFGANQNMAVALQAMWNAIGIQATLQFPQTGAWSGMLTGTWKNGVLFGPGPQYANPLAGWNLTLSPGTVWYGSTKRPAGIGDLYIAAMGSPKLDPASAQKLEAALYNDVTFIPLWFSTTYWAVTDKVMDTGLGTRGIFAWFEPQEAWLAK